MNHVSVISSRSPYRRSEGSPNRCQPTLATRCLFDSVLLSPDAVVIEFPDAAGFRPPLSGSQNRDGCGDTLGPDRFQAVPETVFCVHSHELSPCLRPGDNYLLHGSGRHANRSAYRRCCFKNDAVVFREVEVVLLRDKRCGHYFRTTRIYEIVEVVAADFLL